ncbi:hypothetical protein [Pseudarthrobacter sp. NamB4]|uniref:hypothetical protein n=1 Tax=Pseudarthrobacter sp. NamB4 TaxID=2576837 RepID=UPI0010FE4D16|nr:hypothetical protein [Pseudarthrobacter sp. NamB4]TLM74534.1 hypothetical protein FDW81_04760 [Pseudarthrobacter sp. NamB4]
MGNPPTEDKPQSKLWWNDGSWWADMWTASGWRIHKLDRSSKQWVDTGVQIDSRANTLADTLWDGTHLYIASHVVTVSTEDGPKASRPDSPARLYKYSYSNGKYTPVSGFPTEITRNSSESMTIDKDSTGAIWATWTQVSGLATGGYTNAVMVNSSAPGGTSWGTPASLSGESAAAAPDDISSIVAFGKNKIGVMWSDHTTGSVWWATRNDGESTGSWKVQSAVRGPNQADDHLNIKSLQADSSGRVFAAVKTSFDMNSTARKSDPQLQLLVFKPGTGAFDKFTISTIGDCHTRPQIVLDPENNKIHAFQTGPATTVTGCPYSGVSGAIYHKTASMDNPVFAAGRGTPVIQDATPSINNATTTKQPVTSESGVVVLASDDTDKRYWFADLGIEGDNQASQPGTFVPVNPKRFLDTRQSSGPVGPNGSVSFQVAGSDGIPANASAVVFNLTVTEAKSFGHVRAYPAGATPPDTSSVNYIGGQNVANSVTVPIGKEGKVTLLNTSSDGAHLVADVSGYYVGGPPTVAGAFVPMVPSRLLDTRQTTPVGANGGTVSFQAAGVGGIPANASAVVFNLTVADPKSFGHVRAYPAGATPPNTSNINYLAGRNLANSVTVPIGAEGKVTLLNTSSGTAELISDVSGYYIGGTPTAKGAFVAKVPSRYLDTRESTPVGANGGTVSFQTAGVGGIPANASAVVFNLTVTEAKSFGHVRAYPAGATPPDTSSVNYLAGQNVANSVTVPIGGEGKVTLLNTSTGTAQLISDIHGYFIGG